MCSGLNNSKTNIIGPSNKKNAELRLSEIANLMDSSELEAIVENVFPLSQAKEAQELSRAGHTRGKIVLKVV